jgi:hypothetical protein
VKIATLKVIDEDALDGRGQGRPRTAASRIL